TILLPACRSLSMTRCPPWSTPFPYTTLFRSSGGEERGDVQLADTGEGEAVRGAVDRDALRSGADARDPAAGAEGGVVLARIGPRSEEHTSELQSRFDLVCRLLLEKKKEEKAL